jgi:hypothetical protein
MKLDTVKISNWGGDKDISAVAYLMWDKENLYLKVDVTDDVFYQPYEGVSMYIGDSIQIGIDPFFSEDKRYKGQIYEMVLGLSPNGPQIYVVHAADETTKTGLLNAGSLTVNKKTNGVLYEAIIPFSCLKPLIPEVGKTFGFSIIINDNDGNGRKGWIEWGGGIGDTKCPALWGMVTFV